LPRNTFKKLTDKTEKSITDNQILGITIILVLFFLISSLNNQTVSNRQMKGGMAAGNAALVIYYGDGRMNKFEGPVINNMTVLTALIASQNNNAFNVNYTFDNSGGVILRAINSSINNFGSSEWNFYLNGHSIKSNNINREVISSGDIIEVKYE